MSDPYVRPQTPQAMLHRLPDKPEAPDPSQDAASRKPSRFVVIILASTAVAGKVQIAKSVADALACPLFQGDSLHETAARAASVVSAPATAAAAAGLAARSAEEAKTDATGRQGRNEGRYQRMWLSKVTRTGYLFPEESRPANEGFSGFGGSSSTSTSRRGSASSVGSSAAAAAAAVASTGSSTPSSYLSSVGAGSAAPKYINKPPPAVVTLSSSEKEWNPALMVVTHPVLEQWHKDSIRHVVGEYGIGIIFVPLDEQEEDDQDELPVLKPLDPRTMTNFGALGGSFSSLQKTTASLDEEIVLKVDVKAKVERLIEDIVEGVRDIMSLI